MKMASGIEFLIGINSADSGVASSYSVSTSDPSPAAARRPLHRQPRAFSYAGGRASAGAPLLPHSRRSLASPQRRSPASPAAGRPRAAHLNPTVGGPPRRPQPPAVCRPLSAVCCSAASLLWLARISDDTSTGAALNVQDDDLPPAWLQRRQATSAHQEVTSSSAHPEVTSSSAPWMGAAWILRFSS
jgi:hypothetical protein